MQRLKLKNKKNKRISFFIITVLFIAILTILLVFNVGKRVNDYILNFSEVHATKISKILVNEAVNKTVIDYLDLDSLFVVEKNNQGNIQMIDLNSKTVNEILDLININVTNYMKELESGKSSIIDIEQNLITNTNISSQKEGIIFEVPMGIVSGNAFLSNLGPKIPIKISFVGDLESEIKTIIENYGINNALLKIYVNIKVSEQIIMPLSSKKISISNDIPIAIKMIQGEIPSYYFDDITNSKKQE